MSGLWPFAVIGAVIGVKDVIKTSRQNPMSVAKVEYDRDAANVYALKLKVPPTEKNRMMIEKVNEGAFPPKWTKEKYDMHPKEKAFYREYYENHFGVK